MIREDLDVLAQIAAATGLMDAAGIEAQLRRLGLIAEKISIAVTGYYDERE